MGIPVIPLALGVGVVGSEAFERRAFSLRVVPLTDFALMPEFAGGRLASTPIKPVADWVNFVFVWSRFYICCLVFWT